MRISLSAVASLLVAITVSSSNNAGQAVAFVPAPKNVAWTSMRMSTSSEAETSASSSLSSSNGRSELDAEYEAAKESVISAVQASIETKSLIEPLKHFVEEYFAASNDAARAGSDIDVSPKKVADRIMSALQLGMKYGMGPDRYIFDVRHTGLRGKDPEQEDGNTYDFYEFGCDFFRSTMDLENSIVMGKENIKKALAQIEAGENVVFLANHQSEADPQVFSVMLESVGYMEEGSQVTYVAGHKVTTDLLAIPFSMGRNLLCIHSKKHINTDPDSKAVKQRQNLSAMSAMLDMMKKGGASLWVAPSGGRDRRNVETGEVPIAPFDQKTVDMFRLMGNKSKTNTHFYPLSMVSYDLCPPPDFIDPGVGEQRNVRFVPVGINVMDEVENVGGVESRHLFTENAENSCREGYEQLLEELEKQKTN
mmetsp:Transcript_17203/g.23648  ORF Transcript_17203/g.23648 Transcript_17203/m.23648 type:complete len:422 (-) Transcript_17203:109-1374(-)|eukprot:CAMPEP_0185737182 /NCGR_PEP_ID=MMETSP1171-20130828/29871_1 /TAXON_ID=374046 /ORGANISM="Helicotheca tamensis, Strain CCMP826" /LENGTH=421 /DNA_ID=CAMNT_0028408051 /DNA_START=29 /DNA_END=1294 /DNA_ORIENTATION=+